MSERLTADTQNLPVDEEFGETVEYIINTVDSAGGDFTINFDTPIAEIVIQGIAPLDTEDLFDWSGLNRTPLAYNFRSEDEVGVYLEVEEDSSEELLTSHYAYKDDFTAKEPFQELCNACGGTLSEFEGGTAYIAVVRDNLEEFFDRMDTQYHKLTSLTYDTVNSEYTVAISQPAIDGLNQEGRFNRLVQEYRVADLQLQCPACMTDSLCVEKTSSGYFCDNCNESWHSENIKEILSENKDFEIIKSELLEDLHSVKGGANEELEIRNDTTYNGRDVEIVFYTDEEDDSPKIAVEFEDDSRKVILSTITNPLSPETSTPTGSECEITGKSDNVSIVPVTYGRNYKKTAVSQDLVDEAISFAQEVIEEDETFRLRLAVYGI